MEARRLLPEKNRSIQTLINDDKSHVHHDDDRSSVFFRIDFSKLLHTPDGVLRVMRKATGHTIDLQTFIVVLSIICKIYDKKKKR